MSLFKQRAAEKYGYPLDLVSDCQIEQTVEDELSKDMYGENAQFWRYLMKTRLSDFSLVRRSSGPNDRMHQKKSIMMGVAGILLKAKGAKITNLSFFTIHYSWYGNFGDNNLTKFKFVWTIKYFD